jgi:hypothetical protein
LDFDPYDHYLVGYRSAYLRAAAAVRQLPTGRHRAAFALGVSDGQDRAAPRSRWQLLTALERVIA